MTRCPLRHAGRRAGRRRRGPTGRVCPTLPTSPRWELSGPRRKRAVPTSRRGSFRFRLFSGKGARLVPVTTRSPESTTTSTGSRPSGTGRTGAGVTVGRPTAAANSVAPWRRPARRPPHRWQSIRWGLRRVLRSRVFRGVAAVLVVCLLWTGWSIGRALTGPRTDSAASRVAEWARDHHLGWVVTDLEKIQYWWDPPMTGGPRLPTRAPSGPSERQVGSRPRSRRCRVRAGAHGAPARGRWRSRSVACSSTR